MVIVKDFFIKKILKLLEHHEYNLYYYILLNNVTKQYLQKKKNHTQQLFPREPFFQEVVKNGPSYNNYFHPIRDIKKHNKKYTFGSYKNKNGTITGVNHFPGYLQNQELLCTQVALF